MYRVILTDAASDGGEGRTDAVFGLHCEAARNDAADDAELTSAERDRLCTGSS